MRVHTPDFFPPIQAWIIEKNSSVHLKKSAGNSVILLDKDNLEKKKLVKKEKKKLSNTPFNHVFALFITLNLYEM